MTSSHLALLWMCFGAWSGANIVLATQLQLGEMTNRERFALTLFIMTVEPLLVFLAVAKRIVVVLFK